MTRRHFIATSAAFAAASVQAAESPKLHIATSTYAWGTFGQHDGKNFPMHKDETLAAIASTGITGYEPIITQASEFEGLAARLKTHELEIRSIRMVPPTCSGILLFAVICET